jgi:hypothetical protein
MTQKLGQVACEVLSELVVIGRTVSYLYEDGGRLGYSRAQKEHQNLTGLKIAHHNATTSKYFILSIMR